MIKYHNGSYVNKNWLTWNLNLKKIRKMLNYIKIRKNNFGNDTSKNIMFFWLTSLILIIFKLVWIFFAFKSLYWKDIFKFKNLTWYLWQDFFFFWVLFFLIFVATKFKNTIVKLVNYFLVYFWFSLFILWVLAYFSFRKNFDLIEVSNAFKGISFGQRAYYIIWILVIIIIFYIVSKIVSSIVLKSIKKYKKEIILSSSYIITISYFFITLWIVSYIIKWNLDFRESQNILFNIVDQIFTNSDWNTEWNVDIKKLTTEQKKLYEQKLGIIEIATKTPEKIIENIEYYNNLLDESWKKYIEEIIMRIVDSKPDLIIQNYNKLKSLKDSNWNYFAIQILEKAINKKSYPKYNSFFQTTTWSAKSPNIIMVIMESISAVDSKRVSGINDNLPLLDKIQSQGTTFTNFLWDANASEESHIATLMWTEIIPTSKTNESYYSIIEWHTDPLGMFINNLWYKTFFVSSVSIDFLWQRKFLQKVQFQNIIWSEAFSWKKKYTFDAAPDQDLYDKSLEVVDSKTGKFFMAMQTISTHEPYYTPDGIGEADALKYFDQSLYNFYTGLQSKKFFENWILILVSDHRKRSSISSQEIDKYWSNSEARVILSIIWTWIEKDSRDNNLYQHIDLFYSIKKLLWVWEFETSKIYNDVFQKTINRNRWLKESWLGKKYLVVNTWKNGAILNVDENGISFEDSLDYPNKDMILNYTNSLREYQQGMFKNSNTKKDLKIIAHRGYSKLYLDNTILAFYKALRVWVDGIEFDVSYTKDWENIVIHWPWMEQTTCGQKTLVKNITLEQAKKCVLLNWETLLTLDEMLEKVKTRFQVYFLEMKVDDTNKSIEQTNKAIESVYKAWLQDKVVFTSYDTEAKYIISSYKWIRSARDTYDVKDLDILNNSNHEVFMAPYDKLSTSIVQQAKDQWKTVLTYTVNDTWTAEKMYELWVDIILTDEVELLKDRRYVKKSEK